MRKCFVASQIIVTLILSELSHTDHKVTGATLMLSDWSHNHLE